MSYESSVCRHCRVEIYGAKGDYWHVGTDEMRCADGKDWAYPTELLVPAEEKETTEAVTEETKARVEEIIQKFTRKEGNASPDARP